MQMEQHNDNHMATEIKTIKVRGSCGHIVKGLEILESYSDDKEHQSHLLCPDCMVKNNQI